MPPSKALLVLCPSRYGARHECTICKTEGKVLLHLLHIRCSSQVFENSLTACLACNGPAAQIKALILKRIFSNRWIRAQCPRFVRPSDASSPRVGSCRCPHTKFIPTQGYDHVVWVLVESNMLCLSPAAVFLRDRRSIRQRLLYSLYELIMANVEVVYCILPPLPLLS